MDEWVDGFRAYFDGQNITDNPHAHDTDSAREWVGGFEDAIFSEMATNS